MRLFLASQDLGNYGEILRQMVGAKRQAFVISNARDYYNNEARITNDVEQTLADLSEIGITAERLDLRSFFGKPAELADLIEQKQTGLIFSIGGNVICLATALHASGLDQIITEGLTTDKFVYGGYSAGSMVASNDLSLYQFKVKPGETQPLHRIPDVTHDLYGLEPYKRGMGLIPQYVVPHMNRADHIDAMQKGLAQIEQVGAEAICLNDTDVYVVDGSNMQILRG